MEKTFLITEKEGQAILDFLLKQPYKDVVDLIATLQSLPTASIITDDKLGASSAEEGKEVAQ